MKQKAVFLLVLLVVISLVSFPISRISQSCAEEKEDAFLAILALNYCHLSLAKIVDYNDRIVLDEEYNTIINNINLSKIQDEEILDILKALMDTLTQFKLDERSKEKFNRIYEKKVEDALYNALYDAGSGIQLGVDPVSIATSLVNVGGAAVNYKNAMKGYRQELDDQIWELDGEAITRINEINKTFIDTYWRLMQKHNAPDKWRLTPDQLKTYMEISKDSDDARRYRRLVRLQTELGLFPPYWYYRSAAAFKNNKKTEVLSAFQQFDKIRKGFFRKDEMYSSALMLNVQLTDYSDNKTALKEALEKIVLHNKNNWRKNLFAALNYQRYGFYDEAKDLIQANIDNNWNVSFNSRMLGDIISEQKDSGKLEVALEKAIENDMVRNQDVLHLIGKMPTSKYLAKMKDQILSISARVEPKMLRKDNVILSIPYRWILDDPDNLDVTLEVGGDEYTAGSVKYLKKAKMMEITYNKAVDADDLIEENKEVVVNANIKTKAGKVTITGILKPFFDAAEADIIDKGTNFSKKTSNKAIKWTKGLLTKSKEASEKISKENGAKEKRDKNAVKFVLEKIVCDNQCFQIVDDKIQKCKSIT